jgi:hypothetical protein
VLLAMNFSSGETCSEQPHSRGDRNCPEDQ